MSQIVELPWGLWQGAERLRIGFPMDWSVAIHRMQGAPSLSQDQIDEQLRKPVREALERTVSDARSACIVVDDLARPTPASRILPTLCTELHRKGIWEVYVIIAMGCHRPLSYDEMAKKVGHAILDTCHVVNHNNQFGLREMGRSSRGTPFTVSELFLQSNVKIVVGSVTPNYMAGYGGGAKIILPGLAGCKTVSANHALASGILPGVLSQPIREDIEELARLVGLDLVISCVLNEEAAPCHLYVGDLVNSYALAVKQAHSVSLTQVNQPADVLLLNAFPKDNELTQVKNAFNPLFSARTPIVKEDGVVIVTSAAWDGIGYHALFGNPETLVESHLARMADSAGVSVCLFTPRACATRLKAVEGVRIYTKWEEVLAWLKDRYPSKAQVSVLPQAALQLCA